MGGQRGLQRGDIRDTWWPSPGESLMALESAGRGLGREQAELAGKDPLHWPAVPGHSPPSGTGVCGLCSGSRSAHQACSPPCHPRPSCAYLARGSTSTALLWASGRLSGTCRCLSTAGLGKAQFPVMGSLTSMLCGHWQLWLHLPSMGLRRSQPSAMGEGPPRTKGKGLLPKPPA